MRDVDITLRYDGSEASYSGHEKSERLTATKDLRVILIPGYNVAERDLPGALLTFRENTQLYSRHLADRTLILTWPGNRNWGPVSFAAYPQTVGKARVSGESLLNAMLRWEANGFGTRRLVLVAHSLGCRVIVSFLDALAKACAGDGPPPQESPRYRSVLPGLHQFVVVLMGGAVPVALVERQTASLHIADKIIILHSDADGVLRSVFPYAQTVAAGETDYLPEAIGLRGAPDTAPWSANQRMRGYDHGDYWPTLETSKTVVLYLVTLLRLPVERLPRLEFRARQNELPFRRY